MRNVSVNNSGSNQYCRLRSSFYNNLWDKAKQKQAGSPSETGDSYWNRITAGASRDAYDRHARNEEENELLLSAETLPEHAGFLNFSSFSKEYPERFMELLAPLRPEFQELCIEYYLLGKSQSFLGKAHGFIQTRTWQTLRIIEQAMGAFIVLGTNPDASILRPILQKAGFESTLYGSLTDMILLYAKTQSYKDIAKTFRIPVPAVRKMFRPTITQLAASRDLKEAAVSAYLRSMTHQASLSKAGLSSSCKARLRRVKGLKFTAPAPQYDPLINFGNVDRLTDTPWQMFELAGTTKLDDLAPILKSQGKRTFGKTPAQIFAPVDADNMPLYGHIYARCASSQMLRQLVKIRGVSERICSTAEDGTEFPILIPAQDLLVSPPQRKLVATPKLKNGDFVEILTGPMQRYYGVLKGKYIEVQFPTKRFFKVFAHPSSIRKVYPAPIHRRRFWGLLPDGEK